MREYRLDEVLHVVSVGYVEGLHSVGIEDELPQLAGVDFLYLFLDQMT